MLNKSVRVVIIKMSKVFQILCAKEVTKRDRESMILDVVMATSVMEKGFPSTFLEYEVEKKM
jgi:hypothetical protein